MFIMVPWLLAFGDCFKIQNSVENTQNFHSPKGVKISYNGVIVIYLDTNTLPHINVNAIAISVKM